MKKITTLILLLALFCTACGKKQDAEPIVPVKTTRTLKVTTNSDKEYEVYTTVTAAGTTKAVAVENSGLVTGAYSYTREFSIGDAVEIVVSGYKLEPSFVALTILKDDETIESRTIQVGIGSRTAIGINIK